MNKKIIIVILTLIIAILSGYFFTIIKKSNNENESITNKTNFKNEVLVSKELMNEDVNSFREVSVGAIDIGVDFINPNEDVEDYWVFKISLDTHSADLNIIDLEKAISFMPSDEIIIEKGFEVNKKGSGHHISRFIELPKIIDGEETLLKESDSFKMIFRNIEGVDKTVIEWDMTKYPNLFSN